MSKLNIAKGLKGMALIGALFREPEINIPIFPFILAGDMDEQLYEGMFMMEYGPEAEYYKDDTKCTLKVDRLKQMLREYVQGIFDEAARQDEMDQRVKLESVRQELKQTNQPHAMGTVAEIAAKLGISKSEVRRHKAAGTLDELFKKQLT